jgi:hypothetical protein
MRMPPDVKPGSLRLIDTTSNDGLGAGCCAESTSGHTASAMADTT